MVVAPAPTQVSQSPDVRSLPQILERAAARASERFPEVQRDELAITLIDLRAPASPARADLRGDVPIYPASVVKLFYLAAAHRWLEDGRVQPSTELTRALTDMIVDSSNDATHYVVDELSGTTAGPELPAAVMKEWAEKRNAVNRYFASLGFASINVTQKTWCEGPYGRERAFVGANRENRNALTTNATARLLADIVLGKFVNAARSTEMMTLLRRDPTRQSTDPDDQATAFTGAALPAGARLWSKAGWTSAVRHDAAYVELSGGARFVLVIFTTDHSKDQALIPTIASEVVESMNR